MSRNQYNQHSIHNKKKLAESTLQYYYYKEKYSKWKLHPSHQPPYSPKWSEKFNNSKEKDITGIGHHKHTPT